LFSGFLESKSSGAVGVWPPGGVVSMFIETSGLLQFFDQAYKVWIIAKKGKIDLIGLFLWGFFIGFWTVFFLEHFFS